MIIKENKTRSKSRFLGLFYIVVTAISHLPDEKGAVARPAAGVSRCAGVAVASPRSSAPRPSERGGGGRGRGRAVWARRGPVGDGNRIRAWIRVSQAK